MVLVWLGPLSLLFSGMLFCGLGPFPVSDADFVLARTGGLGQCYQVVLGLHRRLSDFLQLLLSVVGRLLFVVGGIGCERILWLIFISGCVLIWFRLLPFCSVILLLLLGVLGDQP